MHTYICGWCGETRTLHEMRHEDANGGPAPKTCRACRDANPGKAWCTSHKEPHDMSEFVKRAGSKNGLNFGCKKAKQETRKVRNIECIACSKLKPSWAYGGSSTKSPTCKQCDDDHTGTIWCLGCDGWLSAELMPDRGHRCYTCRIAYRHGVTVVSILKRQRSTIPECACCGETTFLHIDHDHSCCPGVYGCDNCVRGYLCRGCNVSEGQLKTVDRARRLLAYMEKHARASIRND